MSDKKLSLAIMWHQHQPFYKSGSEEYQMPWVRFHSTKDYLDMLLVLEEYPEIKQNFNLVPSLLTQVQDYVENSAKDNVMRLTEIEADKLSLEDKKKILANFFLANNNSMIKPYSRFYELYQKYKHKGQNKPDDKAIQAFSVQDFRDLQVWYNLCWIGMESRKNPQIKKLFQKGKSFTEEDKINVIKYSLDIMRKIIPRYKKLWDSGQIELSTSPFYHPILPLLCDNYIARKSSPSINLPRHQFVYPEDAETQVIKGLEFFKKLFGRRPTGMWPSEGSVSLQALKIISQQGIEWVGTDEGILAKTLRNDFAHTRIYQPYVLDTGKQKIHIFFRDHYLSDAIGFVYSNWPAQRAVDDFMNRLHAIRKLLATKFGEDILEHFIVPIILDGENCWEYYEGDGKPFLRKLYERLSEDKLIKSVTLGEIISRGKKWDNLSTLHPGSWINSNYNIWIGAEEDNNAWDILAETRSFLVKQQKIGIHSEQVLKKAWEKIYIAEGSDWNWWYGDEHSSSNDLEFDQLYREHLIDVYEMLGTEPPPVLFQTIKRVHFDRFVSNRPKNFIQPVLDGKSTYFYEWVGAAFYDVSKIPQSAMHQVTRILDKVYVGFDDKKLYLRLDFLQNPDPLTEFVVALKRPQQFTVVVSPLRGVIDKFKMENEIQTRQCITPNYRLNQIFEMAISFQDLEVKAGDLIGFQLKVKLHGQLLEGFPRINLIELEVPTPDFELMEWSV